MVDAQIYPHRSIPQGFYEPEPEFLRAKIGESAKERGNRLSHLDISKLCLRCEEIYPIKMPRCPKCGKTLNQLVRKKTKPKTNSRSKSKVTS